MWFKSVCTINRFTLPVAALLLLGADTNLKKHFLWNEFGLAHMRALPISLATFEKVADFDVVYQTEDTYNEDIRYHKTFIIGFPKPAGTQYQRMHLLSRVDPFREYPLVKTLSDRYQSDTTYLDVLTRNRKNELTSIIYRRVKVGERVEEEGEYIMWKKEKIFLRKNGLTTQLIEQWNKDLFE